MPRNYFFKYPLLNEEGGADPVDEIGSGTSSSDGEDKVKALLKKLRTESDEATKRAKAAEDRLKQIEEANREKLAKEEGDYNALKERLLAETSAKESAAKKREEEAIAQLQSKDSRFKSQFKKKEIKAAFAQVFKSEFLDDLINNPTYEKQLEVVETDDGEYEVIVCESLKDRTQRFKVVDKKTVPFTVEDWANEIAAKKPTAAKPVNRASGDNVPYGNGKSRSQNDFNLNAPPQDLVAKSLGLL